MCDNFQTLKHYQKKRALDMTNNSDNDIKEGFREKIDKFVAGYISDSLKKLIKPEHWEELKTRWPQLTKFTTIQLLGILLAASVALRFIIGLDWTLILILLLVDGYVLWTEKPWSESSFKTFVVYKHPTGELQAVKQGWSWPATWFIWIWAMTKKMWVLGGLLALYTIITFNSEMNFHDIVFLIISIAFGIHANSWYEKKLLADGFQRINAVTAKNKKGALAAHHNEFGEEKRDTDTGALNNTQKHLSDDNKETSQQPNSQLIKCGACGKDMGVKAEICMGCGTKNPLRSAERLAQREDIIKKLVPIVVTVVILIVIFSIFKGVTDSFFGYARALQGGR
jgi:hypothetical protein